MKGLFILLLVGVVGLVYAVPKVISWRRNMPASTATPRPDVRVTIIEGKRREEIARLLAEKNVCSEADFLAASQGKEGYLFPDTYRFYPNTSAQYVVSTMLENFANRTKGLNLTVEDLTLASIVEREAENDQERPVIAGVYYNRLKQGMKLDADPTVQYAKDSLAFAQDQSTPATFWQPITSQDYSSVSSTFNTYLHTGLPPTPIANPGLKSLEAAASPASHPYYYFFHRNGEMVLSKTLQEHLQKLND